MKSSEVSFRYAAALFDACADSGQKERVFEEIRLVQTVLEKEASILRFFASPLVSASDKCKAMTAAANSLPLAPQTKNFLVLLAKKNRMNFFNMIVAAYQVRTDDGHGVVRGSVRSASLLGPEERNKIEKKVSEVTKKQAILTYREDSQVIGGLIAQVGSYTFDDTVQSHLQRLRQDLTRRAQ